MVKYACSLSNLSKSVFFKEEVTAWSNQIIRVDSPYCVYVDLVVEWTASKILIAMSSSNQKSRKKIIFQYLSFHLEGNRYQLSTTPKRTKKHKLVQNHAGKGLNYVKCEKYNLRFASREKKNTLLTCQLLMLLHKNMLPCYLQKELHQKRKVQASGHLSPLGV